MIIPCFKNSLIFTGMGEKNETTSAGVERAVEQK